MAITWVIMVCVAVAAYAVTGRAITILGTILLVGGMFLADQATHLAQENHTDVRLTAIERAMHAYRWLFVFIGVPMAVAGVLLITK